MGRDGSTCKMGRLEAPARDEPGIDQHQRRALVAAREACGAAPASGGPYAGQAGRGQADATGPREAI
jgi:hypothetical protein